MKTLSIFLVFLIHSTLLAQQHPLSVESASLLEPGHAKISGGLSHFREQPFPLSGLTGNLSKIGNLRFAISLSRYVELQTDGTLLNLLQVTKRDSAFNSLRTTRSNITGDIGDFTVWTKFGVITEYGSGISISVRFGVQLPNASNESGLGLDEMNFYSSILFEKHVGGRFTGNVGLGILGDPTVVSQQHDVLVYGFEYYLPVGSQTYLTLQTSGRDGHAGTGVHPLSNSTAGIELVLGDISINCLGILNHSPFDKSKGMEIGLSYLFHIVNMEQ